MIPAHLPFERRRSKHPRATGPIIAYDLETTRILDGRGGSARPRPLYLTAHGENYRLSRAIKSVAHLARIIEGEFLIPERIGTRYVAWNGNRFDVRFVFEAVGLHCSDFIVRPYATRKGSLRGAAIYRRDNPKARWEFLDGISMTGIGTTLAKFVATFAPQFPKGNLDFEGDAFPEDLRSLPDEREIEAIALADYEAARHEWDRVAEFWGAIRPEYVRRGKRLQLAGEYADIPKGWLLAGRRPKIDGAALFRVDRGGIAADDAATIAGFEDDGALREWLRTHPSPPRLAAFREATRSAVYADYHRRRLEWSQAHPAITFDPQDPEHVAYAERDSEALYEGLKAARAIIREVAEGVDLRATIGNLGIRVFERNLPEGVAIWPVRGRWGELLATDIMRGGYVHTERQFDGPVWSYDINQAYAAAMRETDLPCGNTRRTFSFRPEVPGIYRCTIARAVPSPVPFYCAIDGGEKAWVRGEVPIATAITSVEIAALLSHGWTVEVIEGLVWSEGFRMTTMVDLLELLRTSCRKDHDGGPCTCPSDPIGTACKSIGNNSYGKTTEQLGNLDIVISKEPPDEDWLPYQPDDDSMRMYWCKRSEVKSERVYHRPQLGAFITASVRMKVYAAAMTAPESFLKADTDSVTFDRPVTLDVHPTRYGAWKEETAGQRAIIIGKKTYCLVNSDSSIKAVCKGIAPKLLRLSDFERWIRTGEPPVQEQYQLVSWRSAGLEAPMYRRIERRGTDFGRAKDPPRMIGEL